MPCSADAGDGLLQEEQPPTPVKEVAPAEAEPEAHSNAAVHRDTADMAVVPEHTISEGSPAPVVAADGAATDAAPAEEVKRNLACNPHLMMRFTTSTGPPSLFGLWKVTS